MFSVGLMDQRHNGILTTDIHYQVKLGALSVRIRAQRLHVTGPFTGTWQYNKRAKGKKKHIRLSHSALLPGGTFGLCGEVSALYLAALNAGLNEEAICCHGDSNQAAFTCK